MKRLPLLFITCCLPIAMATAAPPIDFPLLKVDHRGLVSQADLIYETPAKASVEGLPIGNGRMGTLVWTSPSAVHLQINRNDVFAVNNKHAGAQFDPTDYCGACAKISVDLGSETFKTGAKFEQRLFFVQDWNHD